MTLGEAIAHAKERARTLRECTKPLGYNPVLGATKKYIEHCLERAEYNEQLAEWLTELQERREAERWIPVIEKLPEKDGIYLVTFFTGLFNTRLCTTASYYLKCGWSMENVIYWRPLPKAPESEAENEQTD